MSCTIVAVPYALAWVAGLIITTATAAAAENINDETYDFTNNTNINKNTSCDEIRIISEHTLIEKSFETPFMNKELLNKTLEEHGVMNLKEDEFGTITGFIDNYNLSFAKMEADKPYYLKVSCRNIDNADEKIKDLTNEYTLNVQEESYMNILDKLKENNMEIEDEEVQDDNTIVLTINLE